YALMLLEREGRDEKLLPRERLELAAIRKIQGDKKLTPEAAAAEWARNKPSWHLWKTAVDLRNNHYTVDQRKRVMNWLRVKCQPPAGFELLEHDVGRGDHVHLATRDFIW